jgi:cytochrome bd-type quinol oxidase subunit 2|tara:strand:- start:746 stop:1009 length:264 start_codon:yes stop_codon:yes gene_type:complete
MILETIKNFIIKLFKGELELKIKIAITASLSWIILLGYLTWWNGLKSYAIDKSFRWDEWFWFGILPAVVPYLFFFLWKKKDQSNNSD